MQEIWILVLWFFLEFFVLILFCGKTNQVTNKTQTSKPCLSLFPCYLITLYSFLRPLCFVHRACRLQLKEESSSLLLLVGMDDGAGIPADGGLLAGSCHAFYIASTNSGFYITLSLWGWWWWWQGMIMLMLRRRGPLVLARRFTSPFPPTLHRINLPHTFSTLKKWFQPDEDERN